jgi:type IV pilus assembly protein PilC
LLSEHQLIFLFRQLYYLLNNGLPLYSSIHLLYTDDHHKSIRQALTIILSQLREGIPFSTILADKLKTPLYITNIIKVGESNGALPGSLQKSIQFLEKKSELKNKLVQALAYPITLLCLSLMIITWIMVRIIPHFQDIYAQGNIPLPPATLWLVKISEAISLYWWNIPLILLITIFFIGAYYQKQVLSIFSKARFFIPLYGTFYYFITIMNFLSNIASLHHSGLPLVKSLKLSTNTTNSHYFRTLLLEVQESIGEGEKFSTALAQTHFFPGAVIRMITAGEESAELDTVLFQLTDYLNEELDRSIQNFIRIIEPLSLVLVGGIIVLIAISFLLPIIKMSDVIQHVR